jgi:hypothetical protein
VEPKQPFEKVAFKKGKKLPNVVLVQPFLKRLHSRKAKKLPNVVLVQPF